MNENKNIAYQNVSREAKAVLRAKEPLDEDERGEFKSWLKTQDANSEDHGIRSHHLMANRKGKK